MCVKKQKTKNKKQKTKDTKKGENKMTNFNKFTSVVFIVGANKYRANLTGFTIDNVGNDETLDLGRLDNYSIPARAVKRSDDDGADWARYYLVTTLRMSTSQKTHLAEKATKRLKKIGIDMALYFSSPLPSRAERVGRAGKEDSRISRKNYAIRMLENVRARLEKSLGETLEISYEDLLAIEEAKREISQSFQLRRAQKDALQSIAEANPIVADALRAQIVALGDLSEEAEKSALALAESRIKARYTNRKQSPSTKRKIAQIDAVLDVIKKHAPELLNFEAKVEKDGVPF